MVTYTFTCTYRGRVINVHTHTNTRAHTTHTHTHTHTIVEVNPILRHYVMYMYMYYDVLAGLFVLCIIHALYLYNIIEARIVTES